MIKVNTKHIKNEVDLILSKFLLLEEKSSGLVLKNNRNIFYSKMSKTTHLIKEKSGLLLPWSRLLDEGMFILYELSNIYKKQKESTTLYYLLMNILKLLGSIKLLLGYGYLESVLIIDRTLIENFQLELISLTDLNESKNIMGHYDDANDYWGKKVRGGTSSKNSKTLREILKSINFEPIEAILSSQDDIQNLCRYVHGSPNSTFTYEVFISNPEIGTTEPFGVLSFNSSSTYAAIVQYVIENIRANVELIKENKTWLDRTGDWKSDMDNFQINYRALLRCFSYYFKQYQDNEYLWNPYTFWDGEDDK
jgi:hypothetical protein